MYLAWLAFLLAAIFEVGGDVVIRTGIKSNNAIVTLFGAALLGGYGLVSKPH
jgi:LPXTG-motif cell wall-anchored protein